LSGAISVDITRAPYRQSGNVVHDSSSETRLWVIWLYKQMGFQEGRLFQAAGAAMVNGRLQSSRQVHKTNSAVSSWPQWRSRTDWSDGNAKFGDVRRCQARKCPVHHQAQLEQDLLPYA